MSLTADQYVGISMLDHWYNKYNNQVIEVSGLVGTGVWEMIQLFIEGSDLDPREVMYLSYNQDEVLDLAYRKFHSYYLNSILYNYVKIVNFDTLPAINLKSREVEYEWKKEVRKKIPPTYKLIVAFDSLLMNFSTINDMCSFGLPIILVRNPMLTPAPDTYTFSRYPNIELSEITEEYIRKPLVHFAHKIINKEPLIPGSYDNVSILPKKQMNLYNLKASDINITITEDSRKDINLIYREKILKRKDIGNITGERVVVMDNMYNQKIVDSTNKKVKVYLNKGLIGSLTRVNRHALGTKYVGVDFTPDCYKEAFTELSLDRHYLNNIQTKSIQLIPDNIIKMQYAYALTPSLCRLGYWDKVTILVEPNEYNDEELQQRLMYTAITRARKNLTIIL